MRGAAIILAMTATAAMADVHAGAWTQGYQMGTAWFSTGESGDTSAGWLSLQCNQAKASAIILGEIKGATPPPGSTLTLAVASRAGITRHRFMTDAQGTANPKPKSPAFLALWNDLRRGATVTIRYADGRSWVGSLSGAGKTLTPGGCID